MRYLTRANRTPLLRNLTPNRTPTLTDGRRGYQAAVNLGGQIRRSLAGSLESGMVSQDQIAKVTRSLSELTQFFNDLVQRESRVVTEGVSDSSDTELRSAIDVSFDEMCEYLDNMDQILFRLRNRGHLDHTQYVQVVNCFDWLRQLHREVFTYIDREPL